MLIIKKNTAADKKKEYYFDLDYRLTLGEFFMSGEYIYKKTEFNFGINPENSGYHLTAGYSVSRFTRLLVRYDSFTPTNSSSKSDYIIPGVNLFPSSAVEKSEGKIALASATFELVAAPSLKVKIQD